MNNNRGYFAWGAALYIMVVMVAIACVAGVSITIGHDSVVLIIIAGFILLSPILILIAISLIDTDDDMITGEMFDPYLMAPESIFALTEDIAFTSMGVDGSFTDVTMLPAGTRVTAKTDDYLNNREVILIHPIIGDLIADTMTAYVSPDKISLR